MVYVAFTFSDPVYCELRHCSDNRRRLVRPGCPTKGIMNANRSSGRRIWVLTAALGIAALSWLLFHEQINHFVAVQVFLHSGNPREEWFEELVHQASPQEFLQRCWATGKVTHRELVAGFLKQNTMPDAPWLGTLEELVLSGTQDGDMSVQELSFAVMASRQDPRLFDCAEALLVDPDPLVRQLGLDYLRKAEAQRGVPAVIPLLDDPDLRVVARAEVALARWTGQDSGVRVRMAIPVPESEQVNVKPSGNVEKIRKAVETRKTWWREHSVEFTLKNSKPLPPNSDKLSRPPVADFVLKDLAGNSTRLSDFKGRPILINFWATWCTACLAEIPDLVALQNKSGNRIAILGVALDGVPDEHGHVHGAGHDAGENNEQASLERVRKTVERAVKTRGINYTVLLDPKNAVGGRFNGGELPTTVIIDASGRLRRRFIGERNLGVFEAMIADAEK
jgi:thiol-disulfide isomerase/thioredoxin